MERFQAASHLAYCPFLIRWLMAAAMGFASPLPFFAVAAMSPWSVAPAPENWPALRVGVGVFAV